MKEEAMYFPRRDDGPTRVVARETVLGSYTSRGQEKAQRTVIRVFTGTRKAMR